MTEPIFSVIMPVHNAQAHLDHSIISVRGQSEPDMEIILIDDGSTDNSRAILHHHASEDSRVRFISQDNCGVSATRNLGIDMARGQLLAFIDADDRWLPHKLRAHRAMHLGQPDLAASFAQIAFLPEHAASSNPQSVRSTVPAGPLGLAQLIGENPVCTMSNLVVRRDVARAIGGFAQGMSFAEDQEWIVRLVKAGYALRGIDQHLVDYRTSSDGLSANLDAMHAGWRTMAERLTGPETLAQAEAIYCRYLARRALRTGAHSQDAWRWMIRGLNADAQAFLADRRRGWLTLIGAAAGLCLPRGARMRLFA
jgi:glycosyltransferase involved in cell wall biosynthesis